MRGDFSPTGRRTRSRRTRTSPTSCSACRCRLEGEGKATCCSRSMPSTPSAAPRTSCTACRSTVDDGEVVSLVGRNGAGRTTIIESIIGLLPVRSGHIRFRGQDITRLPPHRRAKCGIGYAPENAGIFPELTVAENLMISRWLSEQDRTRRGRRRRRRDAGAHRVSRGRQVPRAGPASISAAARRRWCRSRAPWRWRPR